MSSVLDMEVVEELLSLTGDGDPELLLDLINMFLEDAPSKVEKISSGITTGNLEQVAQAAHSLKGSAGNLGVHLVQRDCDEIQVAGQKEEMDVATEIMPGLEQHLAEAISALEELRGQYQ